MYPSLHFIDHKPTSQYLMSQSGSSDDGSKGGASLFPAAGIPGSLAMARFIADINTVQYPEGVKSPHFKLNQNAKEGKFRYDREFLLQFMSLCKEKPVMLPPLDAFGLEPTDQHHMQRQGSIGLGFSPATFGGRRPTPMMRTASQGGPGAPLRDRASSLATPVSRQGSIGLGFSPAAESPEMVDRKVRGLLNKLTMKKFDSISDQIIAWANKSEKEKNGRTLVQVIRLVFEEATDEGIWSEMYARLCRKMMEQISPKVQDDGIKNNEGKPIAGGQLFRKCLLNRCQEDFERGWVAKETTNVAAAVKASDNKAVKEANDKTKEDGKEDEAALYSDEDYAAQKAKRQGLGLIKFIGELFKLQMLTERIMHECVKKLLGNVDDPEEEEIESLCKLLTTVGGILDTPKARAHLDVYFSRMKELTKSPNVNSRMQHILLDLIELRERKWISRTAVAAPTTLAQIHENAAKEKSAAEKESYQRQISMFRGGSRRDADHGEYLQVGPDGWAVAGGGSSPIRPPPKAGDLSNFGKISKGSAPMTFGPSSIFSDEKGAESKRESIANIERHVLSLLRSLRTENVHVISRNLVDFIRTSTIDEEHKTRNMKCIVSAIFDKATDHIPRSTIYAALCKGIMDQISRSLDWDLERTVPSRFNIVMQLPSDWIFLIFQKHLLDICQQNFDQSFGKLRMPVSSEQTTNVKLMYDNIPEGDPDAAYIIIQARRKALGVVKFMAELYKTTKILPKDAMHRCANTLLESLIDPEEQRIEALSVLLTTVGSKLEAEDAPIHLDKWFATMKELVSYPTMISLRAKNILLTLIECWEGGWEIPKKVIPLSDAPSPHPERRHLCSSTHYRRYHPSQLSQWD
ncbi:armadillo-type protein [Pholiota molesta]|nr:armadillo-type protein [Pholiota molesta]